MNIRTSTARVLGLTVALTATGVVLAAPSHAAGIPAEETCVTQGGADLACTYTGAEVFPASGADGTVSGSYVLTADCTVDGTDCPTYPLSGDVGSTGVVLGDPTTSESEVVTLTVEELCVDDICLNDPVEHTVNARRVDGAIVTIYVDGIAIPVSQPPFPGDLPDVGDLVPPLGSLPVKINLRTE